MAFHLDPYNLMALCLLEKAFPQVLVLDGFLRRRLPSVALPAVEPSLGECPVHVGAVGVEVNAARLFQRAERFEGRGEFHPVVRGLRRAARNLTFERAISQNSRPTARAGVAAAGAVGIDDDVLHVLIECGKRGTEDSRCADCILGGKLTDAISLS